MGTVRAVVLVGFVTALAAAVMVAIALAVTLSVSSQSLREYSLVHAEALLDSVLFALMSHAQRLTRYADVTQNATRLRQGNVSLTDPLAARTYSDLTVIAYLAMQQQSSGFGMVFSDYTRTSTMTWGSNDRFGAESITSLKNGRPCPPAPASVDQGVVPPKALWCRTLWVAQTTDLRRVPLSDPALNTTQTGVGVPVGVFEAAYAGLMFFASSGRIPVWSNPAIFGTSSGYSYTQNLIRPLSTVGNGSTRLVVGTVIAQLSIAATSSILARSVPWKGGGAFAVDGLGYLLGVSEATPFNTIHNHSDIGEHVRGCDYFDAQGYGVSSAFANADIVSCRLHALQYPFAPLNALVSQQPEFLAGAFTRAATHFVDSDNNGYFAVAEQVPSKYINFNVFVVVIAPQSEVIGDLRSGQNLAIGIVMGFTAFAVAVSMAIVSVMMKPLGEVVEQLQSRQAFASSDDKADSGAEAAINPGVQELEPVVYAYSTMQRELKHISAYIPKAIRLQGQRAEGSNADQGSLRVAVRVQQTMERLPGQLPAEDDRGTQRSRLSSVRSVRFSPTVRLGNALVPTPVAVLSANVCDFGRACREAGGSSGLAPSDAMVPLVERFSTIMYRSVTDAGGSMHLIHGDQMLAVFRDRQQRRALASAVAAGLGMQHQSSHLAGRVVIRCGAESGTVLHGPAGIDGATAVHILGKSLTAAVTLADMSKLYRRWGVLLASKVANCFQDAPSLENVVVHPLEAVRSPAGAMIVCVAIRSPPAEVQNDTEIALLRGRLLEGVLEAAKRAEGCPDVGAARSDSLHNDEGPPTSRARLAAALEASIATRMRADAGSAEEAAQRFECETCMQQTDVAALNALVNSGRHRHLSTADLIALLRRVIPRPVLSITPAPGIVDLQCVARRTELLL